MRNHCTVVALTGGPCGGKSTALAKIAERFSGLGYRVLIVPEAATTLINGGIRPWELDTEAYLRFQTDLVRLQMVLEEAFRVQGRMADKPALIVTDRGIPDMAAYTPKLMWGAVLGEVGLTPVTARDTRYHGVIHLVTAAKGARDFYTLANNPARSETPEKAAEVDDRLLELWTGHPHLRVINNEADFDHKMGRLLDEISNILGEPKPIETERRFLVELTGALPESAQTFDIVQTYLASDDEREERIRRRGQNNDWLFTHTEKRTIPNQHGSRFEQERIIHARDYFNLLNNAGPGAPTVTKSRTCFLFNDIYFEMDRIQSPSSSTQPFNILEVETEETGNLPLPPFLRVIEEITGRREFSNRALATVPLAR